MKTLEKRENAFLQLHICTHVHVITRVVATIVNRDCFA